MDRQMFAREWLYLVGCIVIGGVVIAAMFSEQDEFVSSVLAALLLGAMLYVLVGAVRLTLWAFSTVGKK